MSADQFLHRLAADSPNRLTVQIAFGAVDNFRKMIRSVQDNPRLSARGQAEEIRAGSNKPKTFFASLNEQLAAEREKLDARRDHFQLQAPSRDVADVLDRQEIRAWLRTVNPATIGRLAGENPAIAEAVISAPAALSGLDAAAHARIVDAERERQFGPELKILDGEAEELAVTESAVRVAHEQLLREVDEFDPKKLETKTVLRAPPPKS